jgi:hypothetical protein
MLLVLLVNACSEGEEILTDPQIELGTYLIITSNAYADSPALESSAALREQDFNIQVVEGSSIGSTQNDFRNYKRSLKPDYVLLVGKYEDFPTHTVPFPKAVECYIYCIAASTKGCPNSDIPQGLFFVENENQLANMVNKIISC